MERMFKSKMIIANLYKNFLYLTVTILVLGLILLISYSNKYVPGATSEIIITSPKEGDVLSVYKSYYIKWNNKIDTKGYSIYLCSATSFEPSCDVIEESDEDAYKSNIYIWKVINLYTGIRWNMSQKIYGNLVYINPGKYFIQICSLKPLECKSSDVFAMVVR